MDGENQGWQMRTDSAEGHPSRDLGQLISYWACFEPFVQTGVRKLLEGRAERMTVFPLHDVPLVLCQNPPAEVQPGP